MSALVDFILLKLKETGKTPAEVADDGGITRQSLNYVLNKKGPNEVRPGPEIIIGIAKGLGVDASLLVSYMGYPIEAPTGISQREYEVARRLLGAPWLAERVDSLLSLSSVEFNDLMEYLRLHQDQERRHQEAERQLQARRPKKPKRRPLIDKPERPDDA